MELTLKDSLSIIFAMVGSVVGILTIWFGFENIEIVTKYFIITLVLIFATTILTSWYNGATYQKKRRR